MAFRHPVRQAPATATTARQGTYGRYQLPVLPSWRVLGQTTTAAINTDHTGEGFDAGDATSAVRAAWTSATAYRAGGRHRDGLCHPTRALCFGGGR